MTRQITVAELVQRLAEFDQSLEVRVEGCDCLGDAGGVTLDGGSVLIERTKWDDEDED